MWFKNTSLFYLVVLSHVCARCSVSRCQKWSEGRVYCQRWWDDLWYSQPLQQCQWRRLCDGREHRSAHRYKDIYLHTHRLLHDTLKVNENTAGVVYCFVAMFVNYNFHSIFAMWRINTKPVSITSFRWAVITVNISVIWAHWSQTGSEQVDEQTAQDQMEDKLKQCIDNLMDKR